MSKRTISAGEILSDLRSGLNDNDLMQKYRLSARALESIFGKLLQAGLLAQSELDARLDVSQRTVALEVFRCPSCDCVQLTKFDECPRCGVVLAKYKPKPKPAPVPADEPPGAPTVLFVGTYKLTPSADGKSLVIDGLNPKLQRKLIDAVSNALKSRPPEPSIL
ncbi:MAG: hypothetical protein LDL33_06765 [Desulfomonile sp.]|nr:hypothetical protein [Desulfomonile sp.]